jgi:TonB family protein
VPLEAEATLLVAGVIASAPDLVERPRRVDAFTALPVAELAGTVDLDASETLRPLGRVDVLPIALVSNPRPSYPAALAQLRRGGRVVVEFTIDSAGAVAPGSFRVVESTDARFTQAVHAVVPQLRFVPAQLDRHAVGLTVRQPFVFVLRPGL